MEIRLNLPQALTHRAQGVGHRLALPWGRNVGKSWFQRWIGWYELVARWDGKPRETINGGEIRGVRIIHLMPTFKQCRDIHEMATRAELEGGPWSFLRPKVDHTRWLITFPGGSWIQWFGAREATATTSRGARCDALTIDEADDIDMEVVDAVADPWFSEPWSLRQRLLGGTPRRGRYGLLFREHKAGLDGRAARKLTREQLDALSTDERILAEARRLQYSFHATWRDAPQTVDQRYVEQVRAKLLSEGKNAIYEREWECNFDSAEGLVYSMWDEAFHVRRPPADKIQFNEFLVGVDHGWEDPGVFLVIGVAGSGRDATLWVLEEVDEPHQLESWWIDQAKRLRAKHPNARWYGDPSRPDRIKAIATGAQVRFCDVNNAIEDGVSAVADRIAPRVDPEDDNGKRRFARLYIDPSCKFTRWEMVNYKRKRDPRNSDRFLEDIQDLNNHAMDALRYPIFSRFGKPSIVRSAQLPPA